MGIKLALKAKAVPPPHTPHALQATTVLHLQTAVHTSAIFLHIAITHESNYSELYFICYHEHLMCEFRK